MHLLQKNTDGINPPIAAAASNPKENIPFFSGLALVVILDAFYVLSGNSIAISPHDQLDGEIFTYILHAEHLGATSYPELMNGIPSTGMQMAAPGMILLYLLLPPVYAFSLSYALISIVSFLGMFSLLRSFEVRPWLASSTSFAFTLLPFYSVYGLSIMGIPAFFYLIRRYWLKTERSNAIFLIAGSFLFSLFSSPVLSGYAVIGCFILIIVFTIIFKKEKRSALKVFIASLISLCLGYILANYELFLQAALGIGYVSHKSEYILSASPFSLKELFLFLLGGQQHAISNQAYITPVATAGFCLAIIAFIRTKSNDGQCTQNGVPIKTMPFTIIVLFVAVVFIAFFFESFHAATITAIREALPGSLKSFQFDRLYWLYPTFWYLLFGLSGELILQSIKTKESKRFLSVLASIFLVSVFVLTLGKSCAENDEIATVAKTLNANNESIQKHLTWEEFFGINLFDEIDQTLFDSPEQKKNTRVVSIGLYPSIALYNGYYCLDGYSNNYPLDYKTQFELVIHDELAQSQDLYNYFMNWGNRCYVFSHEIPRNYMVSKDSNITLEQLLIDTSQLKSMGCGYVFSAAKISNVEQLDLSLVDEFTDSKTRYSVYVYSL